MKKMLAEFIGTCVLVLVGCGSAVFTEGVDGFLGVLGISCAFGLSLMAMIYAVGGVSGCHVNPAVSLAMLITKRISGKEFVQYVVAQILGAFAGSGILAALVLMSDNFGDLEMAGFGANGYGEYSYTGLSMIGALIVEAVLTFVFVLVILQVTSKENQASVAGLVIGLTLIVVHIIGIPLTGTSVNPARSLAPAILTGIYDLTPVIQLWVFIVGPFVGAILAALVYKAFNHKADAE